MKLERNDHWDPEFPVWRVTGGRCWGPFCFSKWRAIATWIQANLGLKVCWCGKRPKA